MNLRILFFLQGPKAYPISVFSHSGRKPSTRGVVAPSAQPANGTHPLTAVLQALAPSVPHQPPPIPLHLLRIKILFLCIHSPLTRFFLCLGRGRSLCARTISFMIPSHSETHLGASQPVGTVRSS